MAQKREKKGCVPRGFPTTSQEKSALVIKLKEHSI